MQFNFTHQSRLPGKRQPFILAGKDERLIRFMARLESTQKQPSRPVCGSYRTEVLLETKGSVYCRF